MGNSGPVEESQMWQICEHIRGTLTGVCERMLVPFENVLFLDEAKFLSAINQFQTQSTSIPKTRQ